MKCIIFLFILIIAGCAGKPHIRPLDGYSDLETKPIIFGSIYGIPDGYDMVLYLRYRGLKGQVDSASAYFPNDRNKTDPIKHFQFCLPIGTWTVEKMEIVKVDHSYNLVNGWIQANCPLVDLIYFLTPLPSSTSCVSA